MKTSVVCPSTDDGFDVCVFHQRWVRCLFLPRTMGSMFGSFHQRCRCFPPPNRRSYVLHRHSWHWPPSHVICERLSLSLYCAVCFVVSNLFTQQTSPAPTCRQHLFLSFCPCGLSKVRCCCCFPCLFCLREWQGVFWQRFTSAQLSGLWYRNDFGGGDDFVHPCSSFCD